MSYQATGIACDTSAIPKNIHITNDCGGVDQPTVTVNRVLGEEITFFSNGTKALVIFASPDGSPFQEATFHVPAGGSVSTGPVQAGVASKSYKYTVVGQVGVNDPIIIVEP